MNKGNFTAKDNFPVSTFTYDFLQQMAQMAGNLAQLGGQNYILSGCAEHGANVTPGMIVINGEVLPFEGGVKKAKITIQETKKTEHFAGVDYPEAYISRMVKFSDTGEYNWSDFVQVLSNKQLEDKIASVRGEPPGFKMEWTGRADRIPDNYMFADGSILRTADYPELAWYYGFENDESFKLPDLRKRFIVGYDGIEGSDYGEIGNVGGEDFHALTAEENGEHQHVVPWGENLNTAWKPDWGYPDDRFNNSRGYKAETDNDNTWPYTSPSGKGKPHENRPPFFTLAFLIKVKY